MSVFIGASRIHGKGAFAGRAFKRGEIVGEYTGERISAEEADERYGGSDQFYIFLLEDGRCIDPSEEETPIKYINHSCAPNCESIERQGRIFIRAIRNIRKGEELTYDYAAVCEDDDTLPCCCGAKNCRGTMRAEE